MIFTAKIEQTMEYPKRMKYLAQTDSFVEKDCDSLSYVRNVPQPYGWIKESGTPPCGHLDVIIMTDKKYRLGDEERVKIIGVFCRNDGDNKFVGVCENSDIEDFSELPEKEKADLHRLYPREEEGEGWFDRKIAEKMIKEYFQKKKRKTIVTVQHTESQHHINGMIGAWADWELTERGKRQAYEIGIGLSGENGSQEFSMYVSDLKRAMQTADEINKTLKIVPEVTRVIREVNAGAGNGQSREWYNANKNPAKDSYDPDYKPFEDAESDRDLWNRLYPFYQEVISNDMENIMIVSHGTALSFLHSMFMGDTFRDIAHTRFIGFGGAVSKFTIEPEGKVIANYINRRM